MRRSLRVASEGSLGPMLGALALSALLMLIPSTASAQAVTGTLLGNVTDSSGGAVPGATVTATDVRQEHQPQRRQQRIRLLHLHEPAQRHLYR